jgi:hypothetical protein
VSTALSEEAGRALAAWLAPYLVEHLAAAENPREPDAELRNSLEGYTEEAVKEFVRGLGDKVLRNSKPFFAALEGGQIGSLELARMIGVTSPRNIPAVLTTPLKRRAKSMGLPLPWRSGTDHEDRTLWFPIDGLADRFLSAIDAELATRDMEPRA